MGKIKLKPLLFLLAAVISFVVALLVFTGVLLKNDVTGRILFGTIWGILAIVWFGQYMILANKAKDNDGKS